MKKTFSPILILLGAALISCSELGLPQQGGQAGRIVLHFAEDFGIATRAAALPDTNEFLLSITDSKGDPVFEGRYGTAPSAFLTKPGSYTVSVRSREFREPLYDAPQYGDTQIVSVQAGKTSSVLLNCYQTNCGLRLGIDPTFPADHPAGTLYIKSPEGNLVHSYAEARTAYFLPGSISLYLSEGGTDELLFTRSIFERQILHVRLSSAVSGPSATPEDDGRISIQLDTSRYWIPEDYTYGESDKGSGIENAYGVGQARELGVRQDIWVYGYIVGGDLSSSKCSFDAPFASRTNLVLAAKSNCRDKEICLSVQLSKGDIRNDLNLVDHEDLLGRQVFLRGDLVEAYYGIPGLQNISEYALR